MGLWQWLTGRGAAHVDSRLRRWREHWLKAAASSEHTDIARLTTELNAFDFPEDEIEIEREMLHALIEREQLASSNPGIGPSASGNRASRGSRRALPLFRAHLNARRCGTTLGAFAADRQSRIFVGSGKTVAAAWHTISAVLQAERDLVLVKNGHEHAYRFRCNSYGDALRAAFIAREILARRHGSTRTGSATDQHGSTRIGSATDEHGSTR